jgi:hypothetical protein
MDFITGLQTSTKQNDAIMVVEDKLSKSAHFIPIKSTCKVIDIANVFMKEIFILHGMPKEIVSDRDMKFTSNFWKSLWLVWRPSYYLAQPITLKPMDRQKG